MNIPLLIKIFESISAICLIISIFKVVDSYKWWALYVFASILYIITITYNGLYWYSLMGTILLFTGLKNYVVGKKKIYNLIKSKNE